MKTLLTNTALATAIALATLINAGAASAAPRHHNQFESRDVALPTNESGGSANWFNTDRSDRASSPYAGGPG